MSSPPCTVQLQTRISELPAAVLMATCSKAQHSLLAYCSLETCQGLLGLLPWLRSGPLCPGAVCSLCCRTHICAGLHPADL